MIMTMKVKYFEVTLMLANIEGLLTRTTRIVERADLLVFLEATRKMLCDEDFVEVNAEVIFNGLNYEPQETKIHLFTCSKNNITKHVAHF